ncbi:MAG: ABC transporter ATP-binding protein [Arcanobacterium sp.]|nr:ABC transporter ATP-binding protein [Arcanobacterium sp.]
MNQLDTALSPTPFTEAQHTEHAPASKSTPAMSRGAIPATAVSATPAVLTAEHVAKTFRLPTEQASGLKMAFLNRVKGIKGYTTQNVLRDVNFSVHQGDFFGIVGRNGSGKSTLLKIISGIYQPNAGSVHHTGKLVPFIELGVGFNPELTGRENVYLNGALLGFTHTEIDAMYADIVDFAELHEFMDQKLKNYSSGMQVRLAFSVAIKAQGDILVLDEVLAVGDEAFQRKCNEYFTEVKADPHKTVILVTHSMDAVKRYCNRAILIKDGEIVLDGDPGDVADLYTLENMQHDARAGAAAAWKAEGISGPQKYAKGLNERVPVLRVRALSDLVVMDSSPFHFAVDYEFHEERPFFVTLTVRDVKRGGVVYDSLDLFQLTELGNHTLEFTFPTAPFMDGEFRVDAQIRVYPNDDIDAEDTEKVAYTDADNSGFFTIRNPKHEGQNNYGLLSTDTVHFTRIV